MIRHTLLLRFGAQTALPERDAVLQDLIGLCDRVGEVNSSACGREVDPRIRTGGFTHAFAVVFGSAEAHEAFLALPAYASAFERLSQAAEVVQVAD